MVFIMCCSGILFGFVAGVLLTIRMLHWAPKHKKILQDLISDAYHVDLLPEVSRIEGLLKLALMESRMGTAHAIPYIEKCVEVVVQHKNKIMDALRKYHKWT